ncbi:MAG: thioredoxin-like domain-containing protein [Lentimonas sp.]
MRIKTILHFVCIGAALGLGSLPAEDSRTWHMIGGGHFEAKLTGVGTTTIALENSEGRTIDFRLSDLKPSDQEYTRYWQAAQSGSAAAAAAPAERSEFAERVYKSLVYSKGKRLSKFRAEPTDNPKYFAFYRSAHWCPPCRAFTPDLVKFYNKQKAKGAPLELVFISSDRSEDAMAEYMNEYDMTWPAFPLGKNKSIVSSNGGGIPNLIVTDADGNKVLDSYDSSGKYIGPTAVMKKLDALLKK